MLACSNGTGCASCWAGVATHSEVHVRLATGTTLAIAIQAKGHA